LKEEAQDRSLGRIRFGRVYVSKDGWSDRVGVKPSCNRQ